MNKRYEKSLEFADTLGHELEKFNKMHYDKFALYYFNAKVINYSETDPTKALMALKELEVSMAGKLTSYYEMFIHLNRGILNFKIGKYNDAIRSFVKYYTNEYYKQSDTLFKLRVAMAELMMHVESKDLESTKIRLEQVRKQFKEQFGKEEAYAEKGLFELIQLLYRAELKYRDKSFQEMLQWLIKDKAMIKHEGSQLINYRQWLKGKVSA